jgi:putative phosphoesterase
VNVGLISDTHGMLRPQAVAALRGSDLIVHAGDVGDPTIVDRLAEIAPVTVVRGNIDREAWAAAWPETAVVDAGGVLLYVLHDLGALDLDPAVAGVSVVISGHSHKPASYRKGEVRFVNPGSAGPRRFSLPITVGRLVVTGRDVSVSLIELDI